MNYRLNLVMLLRIDPEYVENRYTFIISSTDMDRKDPKTAYRIIVKLLLEVFRDESSKYISDVKVINSKDPFVRDIVSTFKVKDKGLVEMRNHLISGILIKEGMILLSYKNEKNYRKNSKK